MRRCFFFLAVPVLFLVGCSGGSLPSRRISLGESAILQVGETVLLQGEGATVSVEGVPEDSRCPVNADCISAGRIRVGLRIVTGRGSFTQEAQLPPSDAELAIVPPSGYRATLSEATPYPFFGTPIAPADYRLTLTLTKVP